MSICVLVSDPNSELSGVRIELSGLSLMSHVLRYYDGLTASLSPLLTSLELIAFIPSAAVAA